MTPQRGYCDKMLRTSVETGDCASNRPFFAISIEIEYSVVHPSPLQKKIMAQVKRPALCQRHFLKRPKALDNTSASRSSVSHFYFLETEFAVVLSTDHEHIACVVDWRHVTIWGIHAPVEVLLDKL